MNVYFKNNRFYLNDVDVTNTYFPRVPIGSIVPISCAINNSDSDLDLALPLTTQIGFLHCNGAEYSKTLYSSLYDLCGTTFNLVAPIDPTHNFRIPDLRGIFPIGASGGGTVNNKVGNALGGVTQNWFDGASANLAGPTLGSFQVDQIQEHRHNFDAMLVNASGTVGTANGTRQMSVQDPNTILKSMTDGQTFTYPGFVGNTSFADYNQQPGIGMYYIIRYK